jgi:hypothetical protein
MAYAKLAGSDLKQGVTPTKKAIKSCQNLKEIASEMAI